MFFLYYFLKKDDYEVKPVCLNKEHMCASDAMIILNYHGPKGQILWKNGSRSFYCEVREAFYDKFDMVNSKRIKAFFVQDFSGLEWGSYADKWILANDAYYVIDSKKDGAMGLTYVPFSDLKCAENFLKMYGGILLKFSEINLNTLSSSSILLKDRLID